MKQRQNKIIPVFEYILLSVTFACLIVFFVLESVLPNDQANVSGKRENFDEGWIFVSEDGQSQEIEIPVKLDVERNTSFCITNTIPMDIEGDTFLAIHSIKQDIKVYIGDELRNEYSTKDKRLTGNSSPMQIILTRIDCEDAGEQVRVEFITDSKYSGVVSEIAIGDSYSIWKKEINDNIVEFEIGIITAFFGILCVLLGSIIAIYYKKISDLSSLGFFMVFLSVWLVCNSELRQLIFRNVSLANDVAFCMVMFLPFVFCMYMNAVQDNRYRKWFFVAEIFNVLNAITCICLQAMKIQDYGDSFPAMVVAIFLTGSISIITMIMDAKRGYIRRYIISTIGILVTFCCIILEIFIYLSRINDFNLTFIMFGLLFLMIVSIIKNVLEIWGIEKEKQKAILTGDARAKFLANMSHEIRTPINAIIGLDEMILRESKESGIREYAVKIKNSSTLLLQIVNDVLDFSKIDSGKMELIEADYNFAEMIDTLVTIVSFRAEKKNIKLRTFINPDIPSVLFGDSTRLKQIITNILTNAVKYTNEGYIDFNVDATFEDEYVVLHVKVSDSGIGIKEEDLDKLFVEFERIDTKKNMSIEGTGLGMSISKNLLKLMGSSLNVDSVYGVGSTFYFDVRQRIVDDRPIRSLKDKTSNDTKNETVSGFEAKDVRILVVDDNELNLEVFKSLLKRTKASIDSEMSGVDCIFAAERNAYDIIFLDHMMPGMDGIETMKRLKEIGIKTPVIALTANAVKGARQMYIDAGFTDYLSKPVDYNLLENMLKQYLPSDKIVCIEGDSAEPTEDKKESVFSNVKIDGVDTQYGALHFNGEEDYLHAIKRLVTTVPNDIENISKLSDIIMDNDNLSDFRIKVHTMKSQMGLIGGFLVQGLSRTLERAAQEEDYETIRTLTPVLVKEAGRLVDELSEILKLTAPDSDGDKVKKCVDETVNQLFDKLKVAAADMDFETMDSIMEELSEYDFSAWSDKFEKLGAAVMNLDTQDIISLADELSV